MVATRQSESKTLVSEGSQNEEEEEKSPNEERGSTRWKEDSGR